MFASDLLRGIARRSRNCAHDLAPPGNVRVLVRYLRFPETLRNAVDVFLASKGLPADVFGECVVWVDLFKLLPNSACLLELAEMTKGRGEKSARKIRPGHEHNSLPEQSGCCFVLCRKQICHDRVEDPELRRRRSLPSPS